MNVGKVADTNRKNEAMTKNKEHGYGVCRTVEDAQTIAATARREGLQGCYPSAAVVLSDALNAQFSPPSPDTLAHLPSFYTHSLPQVPATLEATAEFDYVAEAVVTRSDDWHGDKVSFAMFRVVLAEAVEALNNLDAIKKTLFYGRDLPEHLQVKVENVQANANGGTCANLPKWFKNDKFGEYVLHAIVGAATEAGELLEALREVVVNDKEFDEVNMREEVGDVFWYFAILADTCGFSFEESQQVNIAKLRARYPNKFTAFDANNRNLKTERSILEGVKISPCVGHAYEDEEKVLSNA
ncbi:MAG: hypothetical protein A2Y38_12755 [Spirochaetes bacterium GWB1_59_5]|nr:MAG: hypothetical protein A2Y38_12755 [Spirochaetes bacterium GWB1_59_5]